VSQFIFQKTSIQGLTLVSPFFAADKRGYFIKSFEKAAFSAQGIDTSPWEAFYSHSNKGVLRGLHFQRHHSQDKLVHVLCGAVYDVAVDLREGSDTFGKWEGFYLTAENRKALYIPKGFAHGFLALEENSILGYLCGSPYDSETDGGILWNDSRLAIVWPLERVERIILSEKDAALPTLTRFLDLYGPLCRET